MKYVLYFLMVAAIFGLVALVDLVIKKLIRKPRHAENGSAVRMPRYSFILGIILSVFAVFALLYIPIKEQTVLWLACWVVLAMGVFLLFNFFQVGIFYDDEGFTYRTLSGKTHSYRYDEIVAQQTIIAKSGWNSTLYMTNGEVPLTAAMQGVDTFLNKAFFAWCRQKGIDPDTVENDPSMLVFFPPLDEP